MLWQDESNLVPYQALMLWGFIYFIFFQVAVIHAVSICAFNRDIFICRDVSRCHHVKSYHVVL